MSTTDTARFGRAMLAHWYLDPQAVYLNHGTFGVAPRRVIEAQQALQRQIEAHPARFIARELMSLAPEPPARPTRLRAAAAAVAGFLGARGDDLVFVDNASAGVNAVLRSLRFAPGDEIVLFDQAYGAVARTAAFIARQTGAVVVTVPLPFPLRRAEDATGALEAALSPRTRLAIIDHISSETALLLPLQALAALCRARGVPVLADGAHAPGAIALDIPALGVDWYAANLHKWAFAPRGCGVLWAAPERREGLHPPIISWGLDVGWHQEFDWTGTRDPSPFLCAPEGIRFIDEVLGAEAMRRYNHALAWQAAGYLTARWGTAWETPQTLVGCMVSLPLPARLGQTADQAAGLREWLLREHQIEVGVSARDGRLWLRVAAQVYNEMSDIERLAAAIDQA
ncbi:aminotransferase class V-fold PLP-dependent enzyme [Aquabacterium sp.]|uniref:aminotransferase class V-fold PLP-dependent enzyme n=1 Tax=Aquabacterium sp. TaxID=1872578 RepID=UPI003784B84E